MRSAPAVLLLLLGCAGATSANDASPGAKPGGAPDVARGKRWYQELACAACHGEGKPAPALLGHAPTVALEDGATIAYDAAYVRESLVAPGAKAAKGQAGSMPAYGARLSDEDLRDLVAFLLSGS